MEHIANYIYWFCVVTTIIVGFLSYVIDSYEIRRFLKKTFLLSDDFLDIFSSSFTFFLIQIGFLLFFWILSTYIKSNLYDLLFNLLILIIWMFSYYFFYLKKIK